MTFVFRLSRPPIIGCLDLRFPAFCTSAFWRSGRGGILLFHKLLDIDHGRLSLALFSTLDQADALAGVQLGQQLSGLAVAAAQILHDFLDRVVDVHTALIVIPLVLRGKAHAVKQETVQELCLRGQVAELAAGHKTARDAVKGKGFGLTAVEILKAHLASSILSQNTRYLNLPPVLGG